MRKQKPRKRKFYHNLPELPITSRYAHIAGKIERGMEPRRTSRPRKPPRHISRGKGVAKKKRKSIPIWCFIIFTIGIFLITLIT